MLILTHVVIAVLSIIYATYLFMFPSRRKLYTSYALVSFTVISGSFLAWSRPAHLTQTCISGLTYLGVVAVLLFAAHRKLAHSHIINDRD